jgi:hypothetical protein
MLMKKNKYVFSNTRQVGPFLKEKQSSEYEQQMAPAQGIEELKVEIRPKTGIRRGVIQFILILCADLIL